MIPFYTESTLVERNESCSRQWAGSVAQKLLDHHVISDLDETGETGENEFSDQTVFNQPPAQHWEIFCRHFTCECVVNGLHPWPTVN